MQQRRGCPNTENAHVICDKSDAELKLDLEGSAKYEAVLGQHRGDFDHRAYSRDRSGRKQQFGQMLLLSTHSSYDNNAAICRIAFVLRYFR